MIGFRLFGKILDNLEMKEKGWKDKMYRCAKCGLEFSEPENKKLDYGWDYFCPHCGNTCYYEFEHCLDCGAEITEDQIEFSLCRDCETEIKNDVLRFLSKYKENELQYIQWMLDDFQEAIREWREEHNVDPTPSIQNTLRAV